MDEQHVRERAEAVCAALVAGDVGAASGDFSQELRRNLGEVLALLPLPASEVVIESMDHGGQGSHAVVLRFVGETEEVLIQTRWKERDGTPTIVEVSHLSSEERVAVEGEAEDALADPSEA